MIEPDGHLEQEIFCILLFLIHVMKETHLESLGPAGVFAVAPWSR